MKFLDQAKIYLKSGNGGQGCVSFRREKYIPRGGPDGGDGGRGGDIIFRATKEMNTLIDFRYQQHYKAENGGHGSGANRTGSKGENLIIDVPVGTEVLDVDKETVLLDLTEEGQEVTVLYGGDGGKGNTHYKSATNQAPRRATKGFEGEEREVWLRLKLIADAGLVGLPNAGKSTFLSACSGANPKIADYPFTTLHPNLGVVKLEGTGTDFVLADIPGLIEDAHQGHGLGDRFLGHVERTAVLIHLIDATHDDVGAAYRVIRHELEAYGQGLAEKPELVVLNKIDALSEDDRNEKIKSLEKIIGHDLHTVSAVSGENLRKVLFATLEHVKKTREGNNKEEDNDKPYDPTE